MQSLIIPRGSGTAVLRVAWPFGVRQQQHYEAIPFSRSRRGLHEAQIVEWHVAEGDEVAADDPLTFRRD